jgi:hypothetical protein
MDHHAIRALLAISCIALLAGTAYGQGMSYARGPSGTVGATLLDLDPDTIGLRYRLRVNACADTLGKKIVFVGVRTATPGVPDAGRGTIQADVLTHWVEYEDDLGHAGWPEQGIPHRGEPSLWLRNVDYGGVGRVGLRPATPRARQLFPRQTAGIDRVNGARAGLTSIAAIHQGSILGRDVQITLVRQPLVRMPPAFDWGHRFTPRGDVVPRLPAGTYWPWVMTVEIDGAAPEQLVFLLDEARGQYVAPDGGVSVRTEFFLRPDVPHNQIGDFQMFVWNVETRREGAASWTPRSRWLYGEDATPAAPAVGYGFRRATYAGRPVLEVSYRELAHRFLRYASYYARAGDVLEVGGR